MQPLSVSAVARQISEETGITVSPTAISTLFYKRRLDDERCPVVGTLRQIPADYVPIIKSVLRDHGYLPEGSKQPGDSK